MKSQAPEKIVETSKRKGSAGKERKYTLKRKKALEKGEEALKKRNESSKKTKKCLKKALGKHHSHFFLAGRLLGQRPKIWRP